MKYASTQNQSHVLSRVKLFLALSRTPHALLDMATPGVCALLWMGSFPPARVIILGIVTAFAGYTAVYGLNDLMDHRADTLKLRQEGFAELKQYLDATLIRHPIARGLLGLRESIAWVAFWALLALIGAYILNPMCALIFVAGSLLEAAYCLLRKVSPMRMALTGVVKTSGALAAVIAVDPDPSGLFLIFLFLWLFFWEIGGQNIPADWADIEGDGLIHAKTIPVLLGPKWAKGIALFCLVMAVLINIFLFRLTARGLTIYDGGASFLIGAYLLILPAYRLFKSNNRSDAMNLFNRASYYPLALLVVVTVRAFI